MPRNGQGIYTLPVGNPVITGTTITSTWGNTTMQDIANALTGSVASDGQTTMSGPLNMGSNRINNVDNPVLPQDAATMDYVDTLVGDLGTMARQNADNVQITGGSIQGVLLNLGGTTGQMYLPRGTTVQRTNSPVVGLLRYNTDSIGNYHGFYEGYTSAGWQRFVTVNEGEYTIEYFLVGGGGGGMNGGFTGAGGGGGTAASTVDVLPGSTILTITVGGGGGAQAVGAATQIVGVGQAAGGQPGYDAGGTNYSHGGSSGNGFTGGPQLGAAGGGGAGAATTGNSGGAGVETLITGTSLRFGGGAGGGSASGEGGQGSGVDGGGNGGWARFDADRAPTAGTPNTGGGGGGAALNFPHSGAAGGSGVAFLKMLTAVYTGDFTGNPQVIVSGDYTILRYNGSGTYIC